MELISFGSSILLFVILLMLLRFFIISTSSATNNEPPGPRPLPFLGNLLLLDFRRPFHSVIQLSKKYGSVFTFYMGPKKVVMLVGYKTVKEALVNYAEEFGEREPPITTQEDKSDKFGLTWSNGDTWREMRRFVLTNLKDFGAGKKAGEEKIIKECSHLVQLFQSFNGEPFDPKEYVQAAVCNIISSMMYGHRFEYDDPEFRDMVYTVTRGMELLGSKALQLYNIFPWIMKWLTKNRVEMKSVNTTNRSQNLKMINQLKETINPHMSRGLIDAFLIRQQKLQESGVEDSHFHGANLLTTVMSLSAAGTETTSSNLRWALLYMTKYPHIQAQVREEISRVIGDRQVQLLDRKDLPFTDAVIHETQRFADILPMPPAHRTSRDVFFQGYFIKKGTTIYPLLTTVLKDESKWEKPHSFYPAHFLDKDGKFVKSDAFMPFSAGQRSCPGEGLARMELFLFFVTLMQHFRFTAPPGVTEEELDLTPEGVTLLCLKPHQLCAVPIL